MKRWGAGGAARGGTAPVDARWRFARGRARVRASVGRMAGGAAGRVILAQSSATASPGAIAPSPGRGARRSRRSVRRA